MTKTICDPPPGAPDRRGFFSLALPHARTLSPHRTANGSHDCGCFSAVELTWDAGKDRRCQGANAAGGGDGQGPNGRRVRQKHSGPEWSRKGSLDDGARERTCSDAKADNCLEQGAANIEFSGAGGQKRQREHFCPAPDLLRPPGAPNSEGPRVGFLPTAVAK